MGGVPKGEANMSPPITTLTDLALALEIPSSAWRIDQENHTVLVHLGQLGGKPGITLVFELVDDEEGTWNHQVYRVVKFNGDLSDIENWFEAPHGSKVLSPWATVNALTAEQARAILDAATQLSKGKTVRGVDPKPTPTSRQLAQMYAKLAAHMRTVGPLNADQLQDYEREHWLTKYRPEKRDEPNRLFHFMFRSPLVRTYGVTNKRDDEPWKRHHFASTMFRVVGQQPVAPRGTWLTGPLEADQPVPADRGKSLPEAAKSKTKRKPSAAGKPPKSSKGKKFSSHRDSTESGASKKDAAKAKPKARKNSGASKKDPLSKSELEKLERSLGLGRKRR
jgi:hypothetical protein